MAPFDHVEKRRLAAYMAFCPRQDASLRPAPIAIHHDRDMGR